MQPASRTPEGDENVCPICGKAVCIEATFPPGDAPCPHCGCLLWFSEQSVLYTPTDATYYSTDDPRDFYVAQRVGARQLQELLKLRGLLATARRISSTRQIECLHWLVEKLIELTQKISRRNNSSRDCVRLDQLIAEVAELIRTLPAVEGRKSMSDGSSIPGSQFERQPERAEDPSYSRLFLGESLKIRSEGQIRARLRNEFVLRWLELFLYLAACSVIFTGPLVIPLKSEGRIAFLRIAGLIWCGGAVAVFFSSLLIWQIRHAKDGAPFK